MAADGGTTEGVLYDAALDGGFQATLLDFVERRRRRRGGAGTVRGSRTRGFRQARGDAGVVLRSAPLGAEQSNSSIVYGDRLILKLFRKIDTGVNPDLEVGRFLAERQKFPHIPPLAGAIEYELDDGTAQTLAVLQGFVPNEGDAWAYTLDSLDGYFETVLVRWGEELSPQVPAATPLSLVADELPESVHDTIGAYLEFARLLGQRTAELHLGLASDTDDPAFAPEPLNAMYRRSLYQASRTRADQVLQLLNKRVGKLPSELRDDARTVLGLWDQIERRLRSVVDLKVSGMRIRCHGDYHLGQVLYTGKDFVIMDFEGEESQPGRSASDA